MLQGHHLLHSLIFSFKFTEKFTTNFLCNSKGLIPAFRTRTDISVKFHACHVFLGEKSNLQAKLVYGLNYTVKLSIKQFSIKFSVFWRSLLDRQREWQGFLLCLFPCLFHLWSLKVKDTSLRSKKGGPARGLAWPSSPVP